MSEPIEDKIKRLKSELQVAKQAQELWEMLHSKRKEIETKISEVKSRIEQDTFEHHQKGEEGPAPVEEKAELLSSIKNSQQNIDDKMDDFEDFSLDMIEGLHQELILTILEKFPDQEESFEELTRKQNLSSNLHGKLDELQTHLQKISRLLDNTITERNRVKPRNLFKFIFGRSSNFMITKNLQEIKAYTANTLEIICDLEAQFARSEANNSILQLLTELIVQIQMVAQKRWSYRKIDRNLIPLQKELKRLFNYIKGEKERARAERIDSEALIENWIERFS